MGWWEQRAGLAGKVAVVTGGAGGLGEAISRDLSANGVEVAALDKDPDACSALAADEPGLLVQNGDARDPEDLESLLDAAHDRWGRLDILVNVVGGTFKARFTDTNARGWDALIRANLGHVLHACSFAIPRMQAGGRGGSIVNLTTIEAHRAAPNFAVYSAAKAGVMHFARSLAVELAPDRIRVNNVAPDITPTPGMLGISRTSDAEVSDYLQPAEQAVAIPMGRVGVPTDVSGCVVFLASDLAGYVTGTTLHPDGGTYASSGWFNWPTHGFMNTVPEGIL